jgi:hypothetical protein
MTPKIKKLQETIESLRLQLVQMPMLAQQRAELYDALVMAQEEEAALNKWQAKELGTIPHEYHVLLSYVAEYSPNCEFREYEQNWHVQYSVAHGEWQIAAHYNVRIPGVLYMPYGVAQELSRKLNTGEVEL